MYRLLPPRGPLYQKTVTILENGTLRRFFTITTKPLMVIAKQDYSRIDNDITRKKSLHSSRRHFETAQAATMAQPQPVPTVATPIVRTPSLPLLQSSVPEVSTEMFDVPEVKIPEVAVDKTPLAFEEVPGPAILKLWEKYWKYVPIFGTQLFRSLLINNFTEGRLRWNKNITPVKYLFNEYGPIVRIHGPIAGDIVMIHRPEHIAEVYKQEGDAPIRSGIDILQHYRLHYRKYRLPGPFTMQGPEWTEIRAKLEKPFDQQLSQYFGRLEITCDELAQRIRRLRNRQDEVPGTFNQDLLRWGMECFSILMFNRRLGFLEPTGLNAASEPARVVDALTTAHLYLSRCETGFQVWRFFETPFAKKLFGACDVIDSVIGKYIRQAQNKLRNRTLSTHDERSLAAEEGSPVLEKLLLNQRMHPDDISTLLMDMIILGVQATTNCQGFLLYYLAKNPRVQRRLYEEVCGILPSRGSTLTQYTLKEMPYLKACLQECLRLRPAFPFITRVLPKTIALHGYTIPNGTYLIMANQISSHREENFEDPEKFKPERWLTRSSDEEGNQEFSCLPFGYGVRSCLGKKMAETEMMLLTAKLVREFRIEYDYADIDSNFMMVNVPNKPLRFRFVDRE